jgi:predicted dehydrogenase
VEFFEQGDPLFNFCFHEKAFARKYELIIIVYMKKIRVLLIGLGRIGSSLEKDPYRRKPCTHAGSLLSPGGKRKFQLVAVSDLREEKIQDFFSDHVSSLGSKKNHPQVLPNLLEYKAQELQGIDLAIIATDSQSHIPIAKKAIQLGIKNLLIEKPVALSKSDAKSLQKLATKQNVRIWVNHERRFSPIYTWAKDQLQAGVWGDIKTIHASVLTSALDPGHAFSGKGAGPLLHDGTHAIDFLHWLLGKPRSIIAEFTRSNPRYKLEEQVIAWMKYPQGVHVFLEVGGYRRYFKFSIDIETTRARILLSNDGFHFWETKESKLYKGFRSLYSNDKMIPSSLLKNSNPFPYLYENIYDTITKNQSVLTGNIQDNLEIMDIIEHIKKASGLDSLVGGKKTLS